MDLPTDRLLLMIVAATGFAVLVGGWAAALVHAEAGGLEEWAWRIGIAAVFVAVLVGLYTEFWTMDEREG